VSQAEAAEAIAGTGAKRHVGLEIPPARADQVMPDMRRLLADTAQLRGPSGALDGAQGDPVLRLAGIGLAAPPRQIFDGMTVAVAAGEVHARVDSCRVAPQDLRPADLLDEDAQSSVELKPELVMVLAVET
jgi:hypothetical protein